MSSELLKQAKAIYREKFLSEPAVSACAPGRVNLIGEHVDYNDGFVLPFALPFKTVVVGSRCAEGSGIFYINMIVLC